MNTIKLTLALSLTLLFIRFCDAQPSYTVNGNIDGLDSATLLLLHFDSGSGPRIDTVHAAYDSFTFSGYTERPYFLQILYANEEGVNKKLTEFMLENGTIRIQGGSLHLDSIRVYGSKSNKVLKAYLEEDNILMQQWDNLKRTYDLYKEAGEDDKAQEIALRLNQILETDRVALLKKYVSVHHDHVIAALLPNFCLMETQLTPDDYSEMYDALSSEVQHSVYGQELLHKAEIK